MRYRPQDGVAGDRFGTRQIRIAAKIILDFARRTFRLARHFPVRRQVQSRYKHRLETEVRVGSETLALYAHVPGVKILNPTLVS